MSKAAELAKWGEVSTNGQVSGRRNIVINGAMNVAQRSASVTGLGAADGYFTLDRYKLLFAATAGRLTMTQTADGPSGFANCLKLDCTTADASIAAGEYMIINHRIEGQDLQQIKKGTSDAERVTISFYVKGNANATYMLEVNDEDNTRINQNQFAVTTDWTRIEITLPPDTTGAFDDDKSHSLSLNMWLHSGSTFNSGTYTANTWVSKTNANRAVGITSFFDSTDRTFFITGLQLEVGSAATPFEHRSYGEELALCQRYFQKSYQTGVTLGTVTAEGEIRYIGNSGYGEAAPVVQFKTTMRVSPTKTFYSPTSGTSGKARNHSTAADVTHSASNTSSDTSYSGSNYGAPDGNVMGYQYALDSELQVTNMNIQNAKYYAYNGDNTSIIATVNNVIVEIPLDPANTDYQAILEWVEDGNTIEDAD